MTDHLPEYICRGEAARLFPVLATTSKEGRTTSIVLACMAKISEFGASLLSDVGQKIGTRAKIETFTEIVFASEKESKGDRPDGLIVVTKGKSEWRALVEAKVGNTELDPAQIERYRALAKEVGVDCVITISNPSDSRRPQEPVAHPGIPLELDAHPDRRGSSPLTGQRCRQGPKGTAERTASLLES